MAATAFLAACSSAHYSVNQRLEVEKGSSVYAMRNLKSPGNSESLLVLVAISGGGYRAAALGYGVLQALRETPIEWDGHRTSLLGEVDFITGVSGGSLVTAYYMPYGDQTFERFEQDGGANLVPIPSVAKNVEAFRPRGFSRGGAR